MENFRDSTFPCSAEQSFLGRLPARAESEAFDQGSLHGQERNAICEANRESESMHPLSERDRAKKDYGKVDLEIFENACRYFLENISEFKDLLSEKVPPLKKSDWLYSKGRTKTCKADETGKKKKCKVGLEYTPNLYFRIYLCKI